MNPNRPRHLAIISILLVGLLRLTADAAEQSLTDQAKQAGADAQKAVSKAVEDSKDAINDAGEAVGKTFEDLWRGVDENRLKNRTPDELVAWAIMGVLAGAVAGMATQLKPSGLGRVGRLVLGLAGAFIGGMIVHVAKLDFGWGPVLIRYEDLLFSLLGALALIIIGRIWRSKSTKPPRT